MSKKVAVLVTDMVEDVEYTSPVEALEQAGHEVVAIEKEAGKTVKGKQGKAEITIDKGIDEANPDDYDALYIPGGYSPDQLRADERFLEFAQAFDQAKKPIFTICHGPQLLINAKVVDGKKITSVKQVGIDLENAGALWEDSEVVVDDSGLVSSRTPEDLPAFNQAILDALSE